MIQKSQIRRIVREVIFEGYGPNLGYMTPGEMRSVNLMKEKILNSLERYFYRKDMLEHDLEITSRAREELADLPEDPNDYDSPPRDLSYLDKKIAKLQRQLDEDDGKISVSFPDGSSFWKDVAVKPRVIRAISGWLANEKNLNGRWVTNEQLVIDTTRTARQRAPRGVGGLR